MPKERFAELFADQTISRKKLQPGDRIQATVATIGGEHVFLDIGGKSEGVIMAAELRDQEGRLTLEQGDTLEVFFLGARNGELIFTSRLGSGRASIRELEEAFHAGIPVEGRVTGEVRGGFAVQVAGQRCFCPYSQMDIRRIEDPAAYLDQSFSFQIIEFGNQGRNIILSARKILELERTRQRAELKERLAEGDRIQGTVTSIRDFGAFVDLGGVDGLIPISELAWDRVTRVDDILEQGQQVEVVIKRLDWEHDRISLSLKDTQENPWDRVAEKYPPESIHNGIITRLAPFGAFVTLEPGVDGLVHISRLGQGRRLNHPREVVQEGQEITVRVDDLDQEQQRIALSVEDEEVSAPTPRKASPRPAARQSRSLGTLGDLLKKQLHQKGT